VGGLSQAAAAALLTGASFEELANQMLAGLAVQAAGEAIWQTIKGFGALGLAALGSPNAAAAAELHFQAAGMAAAFAVAAGAGAMATGGMGGESKPNAGGGSSFANGGGANPYQGTGGGDTQVSVYIGGEQVTGVVVRESRKQAHRGGYAPRIPVTT
jgi:hypothetical protein